MLDTSFPEFPSLHSAWTTRDLLSDIWKMQVKLRPYSFGLEDLNRRGAAAACVCCHLPVGSPGWCGAAFGPLDLLLQHLSLPGQVCVYFPEEEHSFVNPVACMYFLVVLPLCLNIDSYICQSAYRGPLPIADISFISLHSWSFGELTLLDA